MYTDCRCKYISRTVSVPIKLLKSECNTLLTCLVLTALDTHSKTLLFYIVFLDLVFYALV